jgi:hypothetical protein
MTACCPSKSLFLPLALLLGAGALALGASSFAGASQDPKPPVDKPHDGGEKPDGPRPRSRGPGGGAPVLHDEMEGMNAALKALKKELAAKDPNAWRTISQFQRGVASAKLDQPKSIQELPEGERAAAVQVFRTMMADLLQAACKLEHEVLAGKWDEANKTLTDVIKPMKERGHDKFNVDD